MFCVKNVRTLKRPERKIYYTLFSDYLPVDNVCQTCKREADRKANELGESGFVGHACKKFKHFH